MERRNNLEICAEILRLAEKGARKTHIAYGIHVNHHFLEKYLRKLEDQELITRNNKPGSTIYTTEKGLNVTQQYQNLCQLISL